MTTPLQEWWDHLQIGKPIVPWVVSFKYSSTNITGAQTISRNYHYQMNVGYWAACSTHSVPLHWLKAQLPITKKISLKAHAWLTRTKVQDHTFHCTRPLEVANMWHHHFLCCLRNYLSTAIFDTFMVFWADVRKAQWVVCMWAWQPEQTIHFFLHQGSATTGTNWKNKFEWPCGWLCLVGSWHYCITCPAFNFYI